MGHFYIVGKRGEFYFVGKLDHFYFVGEMRCRTCGISEMWGVGNVRCWRSGLSEERFCQKFELSEESSVGGMGITPNGSEMLDTRPVGGVGCRRSDLDPFLSPSLFHPTFSQLTVSQPTFSHLSSPTRHFLIQRIIIPWQFPIQHFPIGKFSQHTFSDPNFSQLTVCQSSFSNLILS